MTTQTQDPEAPPLEKRLSRDERRALEKIVKNDYQNLREEIAAQAQKAIEQGKAEVRAENRALIDNAPNVNAELRSLIASFRAQLDEFVASKRRLGYEATSHYSARDLLECHIKEFTPKKVEDAERQVTERVLSALRSATRNLNRMETNTMREVLLTGIASSQAQAILESMPSAEAVLTSALTEDQAPAILGAPR